MVKIRVFTVLGRPGPWLARSQVISHILQGPLARLGPSGFQGPRGFQESYCSRTGSGPAGARSGPVRTTIFTALGSKIGPWAPKVLWGSKWATSLQ